MIGSRTEEDKDSLDPGGDAAKAPGKKPPSKLPEQDPALNNPDSTPGTGMLPEVGDELDDSDMQPSS